MQAIATAQSRGSIFRTNRLCVVYRQEFRVYSSGTVKGEIRASLTQRRWVERKGARVDWSTGRLE